MLPSTLRIAVLALSGSGWSVARIPWPVKAVSAFHVLAGIEWRHGSVQIGAKW